MLEWLDSAAREIGGLVITGSVIAGYMWLCFRSPLLGFISRVALMALWGLATAGAAIFVAYRQLEHDQYLGAVGALVAGGALSIPWFACLPAFRDGHFPPKAAQLKLWA